MTDILQWIDDLPKWGQLIVMLLVMFAGIGLFGLMTYGDGDGYD